MKFLNFKKSNVPPLSSLRKSLFDTDKFWFVSLGLFLFIFIVTALIGFKLFYSVYYENYKTEIPKENADDIINVSRLKSSIQKRSDFINATTTLPTDPSI